jgi:FtsH-binding integral membrane protein
MVEPRFQTRTGTGTQVQIDQGLRSYMLKVYNYMGAGLAITGAAAYGTFQAAVDATGALTPFGETVFVSPL